MMRRIVSLLLPLPVLLLSACSDVQDTAKRVQDIGGRAKGAVNEVIDDGKHVQQAISGAVKMMKNNAALVGSGMQKLQQAQSGAERGLLW